MIQGIFHPGYARLHQQTGGLLQQPNLVAFRGEGGEAERVPDRSCQLAGITNYELWEEEWEALLPPGKYIHEQSLDLEHFVSVWEGRKEDVYAEMAVVGTIAIIFRTLGLTHNQEDSFSKAKQLWDSRHITDAASSLACQGA
jgi:anthranilate phosphoribosyltransferase